MIKNAAYLKEYRVSIIFLLMLFKMFYAAKEYNSEETMKIVILDGHNSIGLWFLSVGLCAYICNGITNAKLPFTCLVMERDLS